MANIKSLFALLIVFAIIGMIAFATVTMLSMEKQPDPNSTPDLANESATNAHIQKPFLSGFDYLLIAIILAMIGIVIVMVLSSLRNSGGFG